MQNHVLRKKNYFSIDRVLKIMTLYGNDYLLI